MCDGGDRVSGVQSTQLLNQPPVSFHSESGLKVAALGSSRSVTDRKHDAPAARCADPSIFAARCRRNRSSAPFGYGLADRQFGFPAQQPVARLEGRTYASEVVGKSGAGMERSTAIVVFPWLARARLGWARMLLARREDGDAARAGELLDQALAIARELGLANIERRAVALVQ
jgi:hypothetical protein